MKTLFPFAILLITLGCSSAQKTIDKDSNTNQSDELYSATCMIDDVKIIEEDFKLISVSGNIYKIKAKDGKILGLPQTNCFLIRSRNANSNESIPLDSWKKLRFVSCKIKEIQFNSSPFHVVEDAPHYFKTVRSKDKSIFYYPRLNCSIHFAPEEN